jgi:thiol-disulfide isomerase/thioredoxin
MLVADARLQPPVSSVTAASPLAEKHPSTAQAERHPPENRATNPPRPPTPLVKPNPPKSALSTLPVDDHPQRPVRFEDVIRSTDRRAVLVNFWATWCEPCKREFPELAALVAEHKGDFRYVGIVTDASSPDVKDRIDQISPTSLRRMQFALQDVSVVNRLFPRRSYDAPRNVIVPLFALFDAGGRVVFTCEGTILDHQNSVDLQAALTRLKRRDEK